MDAGLLDIGEVSRRTGLAPSALRYYEAEGLIRSRTRSGLRRPFDAAALERLAVIRRFRHAGFRLAEIKQLLATEGDPSWKALGRTKHAELGRQIAHLTAVRDALEHALQCPSPNLFQCPHFRRSLALVPLPVPASTPHDE
jgi:DNA-binding transcriptional MerR regulator